jgi:GxxExxY protein
MLSKSKINNLIYKVNGAAIEVHKALGPGLLESVYSECLQFELKLRGISFRSENHIPLNYKGLQTSALLRFDLLVEEMLVVELKSVKEIEPIHEAQILSYMKLLKLPKGLIINFNVRNLFIEGQKTYVNQLYYELD